MVPETQTRDRRPRFHSFVWKNYSPQFKPPPGRHAQCQRNDRPTRVSGI